MEEQEKWTSQLKKCIETHIITQNSTNTLAKVRSSPRQQ